MKCVFNLRHCWCCRESTPTPSSRVFGLLFYAGQTSWEREEDPPFTPPHATSQWTNCGGGDDGLPSPVVLTILRL